MGGRTKNRLSSEPEPRQVRDALRDALTAAYDGRLRTWLERFGMFGKYDGWAEGLPSGASLRHLAPDLARVGVSIDDVLLRPHVVPWRLAVERWRPAQGASLGEVGLWLRVQDAVTRRRADTLPPDQGGTLHVRLEAGSAEEQALCERFRPPQDTDLAAAHLERVKRLSQRDRLTGVLKRIDEALRRPLVILFRVIPPKDDPHSPVKTYRWGRAPT